jgi:histone-lysine N-methyltransferase SETMAR
MVMAFFDSRGLIYSDIIPRGAKINPIYIVKVQGIFLKKLRQKRLEKVSRQWFFQWANAPVHTTPIVQAWIAANNVQVLEHPPYSPDLAPADYFLFQRVKRSWLASG